MLVPAQVITGNEVKLDWYPVVSTLRLVPDKSGEFCKTMDATIGVATVSLTDTA